jgi:hypothetical protein
MKDVENFGTEVVRGVLRVVAAIVGAIGAIILIIVNAIISGTHFAGKLLGHSGPQSHGVIGIVTFLVGAVGVFTTLLNPKWGAAMMAVAGLGFIYVAGWFSLFATPILLIAALIAYLDRPKTAAK